MTNETKSATAPAAAPKKKKHSSDLVKVKNISNIAVNVSTGKIKPDAVGKCTRAEASSYKKKLEIV